MGRTTQAATKAAGLNLFAVRWQPDHLQERRRMY